MTDLIIGWNEKRFDGDSKDSRMRELERRIARLEALIENSADRFLDDDLKARGLKGA